MSDPLIDALNTAPTQARTLAGRFADRPEVLDAIKDAYQRGVSIRRISRILRDDGHPTSPDTIKKWLVSEGLADE